MEEKATPTRQQAMDLLKEFNENESLIKHALAVEGVMRYLAEKNGEDPDHWGGHRADSMTWTMKNTRTSIVKKPRRSSGKGAGPEADIRAVISHGYGICTDVKPETLMEKYLFAIDELTGLVAAAALVRPTKSVLDMKPKSVKKKWKDKRFAAGVDRGIIQKGAEMLGSRLPTLSATPLAACGRWRRKSDSRARLNPVNDPCVKQVPP